ncbi:neuromedin-U receptor 2-like [Exaiptasia diaphana]|uniref:G-protein coupled receptors family 1 profile domain-containing protein n=1 Tax=Exaiptasia diaphana TaxID=2652724 RepID=A0A913YQS8_EXADI|nr:neuromedin-U receptor 2-like [Exaiptasia diaphana]
MPLGENQCTEVRAPFGLSITTSVITSLLTVITAPGNFLICIAILKDPNKELRTAFNYLLMNVAISDLLVGAITDPIFVLFHIREALGYPVITWYVLPHMSFFIGCTSSLLSIAMLAIERAIAVNASYHRKLPRKRAIKMSVAIWIFSIAFPCIYFELGYFKFAFIFSILMIIVTFATLCVLNTVATLEYSKITKLFS